MSLLKHVKVASKMVKNGGNVKQAMIDTGYSKAYAKNSQKLIKTKSWQELSERFLPDEKLLRVHAEGLDADKVHTSHTEPDQVVPDYLVRAKYLDMGYKIKGKYNENPQERPSLIFNFYGTRITTNGSDPTPAKAESSA